MAVAADALLWELNRLSFAIDRIQKSCQYQAKLNQDVSIAHDVRSIAREASAAPAASFRSRLLGSRRLHLEIAADCGRVTAHSEAIHLSNATRTSEIIPCAPQGLFPGQGLLDRSWSCEKSGLVYPRLHEIAADPDSDIWNRRCIYCAYRRVRLERLAKWFRRRAVRCTP